MKRLIFLGDTLEAEKIIKGDNYIIGKSGDIEVFKFSGISDFSGYELQDGAIWDGAVAVELSATDEGFIRVSEDLIDVLVSKGVIILTDLPQAAQDKIAVRKVLRSAM